MIWVKVIHHFTFFEILAFKKKLLAVKALLPANNFRISNLKSEIISRIMGIHGLMKLLSDECPGAIKEQELSNLTGRKIAVILFVLAFIALTLCVCRSMHQWHCINF
jgi:hypothetical protein